MRPAFLTPGCCAEVKERATVFLEVARSFCNGDLDTLPTWKVRAFHKQFECVSHVEAKCCPHCGTDVPAVIKRRKPLKKVCVVTDGGYYCDTCERRLMECRCRPPAFHWEVAPAGATSEKPAWAFFRIKR